MKPTLENVQPAQGSSIACLDIDVPEFDHQYHYHPEIELTWILEGDGERLIGDSMESFGKGDLVLIGASVPHRFRNWQRARARSRVIQFRREIFGDAFLQLPEFVDISRLLDESLRGLSFSPSTTAKVQDQMADLFSSEPGPRQITQLLDILHQLSEDRERKPLASLIYNHPIKLQKIDRLERVLNFLEQNWQDNITLKDAAEVAALHPQSVSRFFRQHLGMSFQDYLIRLRLARAARDLLESDRTVADIAFHSGFNNLTNFNRHFKTIYQQSPSHYRKLGK
ncbi:helix-turn-helix domain-containing protein [Haloferula chungangensis]|uniref:Helix-turn-helix domain-containing protein n=1 Tax=Haloferula chungangensis TaxID=1048331 RepID=A0ABW2L5Q8_9BACT